MTEIIRVMLGAAAHGVFEYTVPAYATGGSSRQPLLDACRQVKRLGADPKARIGLFRPGDVEPSLSCSVEVGAATTVREEPRIRFARYHEFDKDRVKGGEE